jgi:outer membrane cobalamin receptor
MVVLEKTHAKGGVYKMMRRPKSNPWRLCLGHEGGFLIAAFFLLFVSAVVPAAKGGDEESEQSKEPIKLEDVVVTAPIIHGNLVDRYGAQTTVVGKEQILDLNANDFSSALRMAPGVNITRYNMVGSFGGAEGGAIFIRGLGSSRPGAEIQTLIDGVPIYNSVWNHPLLDLNTVDVAESIEVYKGPQPTNFGNALGAVNIVPKRQNTEGYKTRFAAAYGSHETFVESAEHGGKVPLVDYYIGQGYRTSDGHRDDSSGQTADYYGRVNYQPSTHWDLGLFALGTDNESEDPGKKGEPATKEGEYDTSDWLTTASLRHHYDWAEGEIKGYWNAGKGDWRDQVGADDNTLNDWDLYGMRAKEKIHLWKGGEVLLGLDLDYIEGETKFTKDDGSKSDFSSPTFSIVSPYAGVSHQFGDKQGLYCIPSAGVRYYDHSDFDDKTAPQIGLVAGYKDTELHGTYAKGVNYPGLNVVVFHEYTWAAIPGNDPEGWKDLEPETLDHYEFGVSQKFGSTFKADLTYFYDDGKDRYVVVPPPPPPPTFENIEEFRIKGVEATAILVPIRDLSLFGGITYLDVRPSDLPYAPNWTVSGGLNYRFFENFKISVDAQYVDDMYARRQLRVEGDENTEKVNNYFLLNSKLSYFFNIEDPKLVVEVFLAGENLTDEDYEYRRGYPMPGAVGMVGLSLTL